MNNELIIYGNGIGEELMNSSQFAIYRDIDDEYISVVQTRNGVCIMRMKCIDIILDYFCEMLPTESMLSEYVLA